MSFLGASPEATICCSSCEGAFASKGRASKWPVTSDC